MVYRWRRGYCPPGRQNETTWSPAAGPSPPRLSMGLSDSGQWRSPLSATCNSPWTSAGGRHLERCISSWVSNSHAAGGRGQASALTEFVVFRPISRQQVDVSGPSSDPSVLFIQMQSFWTRFHPHWPWAPCTRARVRPTTTRASIIFADAVTGGKLSGGRGGSRDSGRRLCRRYCQVRLDGPGGARDDGLDVSL